MFKRKSSYLVAMVVTAFIFSMFSVNAFATATTSKQTAAAPALPANYKGVVMYSSAMNVMQLSTEGFSANNGPKENFAEAGIHYPFIWCETMGTTGTMTAQDLADQKVAPRYFRVMLTKNQKLGKDANANFLNAIQKQYQAPTINFGFAYNASKNKFNMPTGTVSLPRDATKVLFDFFCDDIFTSRQVMTKTDTMVSKYITAVTDGINQVKKVVPKAKIYVCSVYTQSADFPRFDDEHIMKNKYASLMGILLSIKPYITYYPFYKSCNDALAKLCKQNGYTYIDLNKSGLYDPKTGFKQEKYVHEASPGGHLNQAGLTLYGDYICNAMGIKTAKQMYVNWPKQYK